MTAKNNIFIARLAKQIVFVLALCLPVFAFSQSKKTGSVEYLKYCNGLNGITLGSDIAELPAGKLAYLDGNATPDADSCITYEYQNDEVLKMPDSLQLNMVAIRTYKNKIVNIYVFFNRKDAYKILSDFLHDFGQFNEKPYMYQDIYNWNSRMVSLSLSYENKIDTGVAVFTCNELVADIANMKEAEREREEILSRVASIPSVDTRANLSPQ